MNPIVQLIIQQAPSIIALLQQRHAANNPEAPPLTAGEITAGFEQAFSDSIAKDELIRAMLQAA